MRTCEIAMAMMATTSHAGADVPAGVLVDVAVGTARNDSSSSSFDPEYTTVLSARLDVGIRLDERVMLAVHGRLTSSSHQLDRYSQAMFSVESQYGYRPVDIGVGAHYMLRDSLHLAGWVGGQRGWQRLECRNVYVSVHAR